MLLRSSSTPVLGSLLSSISESPNNSNHHHHEANTAAKHHHHHLPPTHAHHTHKGHNKRSSFGSLNFPPVSCNSSPISPSVANLSDSNKGFRRAQSEGNLEGLAYASCNNNISDDHFYNKTHHNKFLGRNKGLMLETIPSFSFSDRRGRFEEEEDDEDRESDLEVEEEINERGNGERVMAVQGAEYALENDVKLLDKIWNVNAQPETMVVSQEMYLARGLGIGGGGSRGSGGGGGGGGGGGEYYPAGSGGDNGNNPALEEYYKKMVEENPGNPLFLRNYAQYLYQSKQDLHGAEEYYSRAILADPADGEVLSQYAKLVWELHGDQDRASTYHERAVLASPEDSHVQAAYAGFLWDNEEDDVECHAPHELNSLPSQFQQLEMHVSH